jgi:SNF2 family DNA or RNA helicase
LWSCEALSASLAPLRDYQQQGVRWLHDTFARQRALLLADEAGLGKTRQALAAAKLLNADRILIVCPAGARRVWQNEIEAWVPDWSPRVVLIEPRPQQGQVKAFDLRNHVARPQLILVIGYDALSNFGNRISFRLRQLRWDLLIVDEAHYLKNPSNRTHAIYGGGTHHALGLQTAARKVLLLTGTPSPNHAGELWQHYRTFWPDALGKKPLALAQFEERFTRYRTGVYGRQITGSQNQGELRKALGPVILRRRKLEVLTELPPLIIQDIPLDLAARLDFGRHTVRAAQLNAALSSAGTTGEALKALHAAMPDASTAALRQTLGLAKVPPTLLWVQERMASTKKLLIFAWHHAVIEHLRRGLLEFGPVVVTGETSPALRATQIAKFQLDPNARIFIGQILAAGTAITLTAASEVAIVEPSWVPGENVQAICRAHRLGQRDSVLASFLYLPGTLDQRIMKVFRRKAVEIAELQGDDFNASNADIRSEHGGRGATACSAAGAA